jgi:hypothetical protein
MTTLCDIARRFPLYVAEILECENKLRRGHFREETLTDLLAASIVPFAGPTLTVGYPVESLTGGDVDLVYWSSSTGRRIDVRLQAKRLSSKQSRGRDTPWERREYARLLHTVGEDNTYQYETLLAEAGKAVTLYAFYNHRDVVDHWLAKVSSDVVAGVNLAFADDIGRELDTYLAGSPRPTNVKRLSHLYPYFFELSALFCSSGTGPPSPFEIADALDIAWQDISHPHDLPGERRLRRSFRDLITESSPPLAEGAPFVRRTDALQRTTIVFVSGSEPDAS